MKTALAVVAACITLVVAETAQGATLRLTPAKGKVGSRVTAVGTGFPAGRAGTVTLAGRVVAPVRTNGSGAFTRRFRVPRVRVGARLLVAQVWHRRRGRVVSVYTVTRRPSSVSSSVTAISTGQRVLLSPISGASGQTIVRLVGARFAAGAAVSVLFAGSLQAEAQGTSRGTFATSFQLPTSEAGRKIVTVQWGGRSMTIPFTVQGLGTWTTRTSVPVAILDAGGTALGGKLYFVGGKTSAAHLRSLYVYDPSTNAWATKTSLPAAYPAVENTAVVAYGGMLYVFGGSTAAFAGAVTSAAVYDPAADEWTMLTPMPVARGGATAEAIGSKIYVVGGMDATGTSLASMSIYDPAANTWTSGASMGTRRDNPGSAVLTAGGSRKLFVFGGRTRGGTPANDTLATVEMYDPATNGWTNRASMPTGRRTMAVGELNGKAQLMGGERSSTATGTFPQNEEYNPATNSWRSLTPMLTPRHGAVAGTIGGVVYVAGGGPSAGSSYTNKNEAFTY